jgi:hypothetical protein
MAAAGSGDVEKLQVTDHLCTPLSIRGRYACTMGRAAGCRRRSQQARRDGGCALFSGSEFSSAEVHCRCSSPGGGPRLSSFRTVERSRPAGGFPPRSLARSLLPYWVGLSRRRGAGAGASLGRRSRAGSNREPNFEVGTVAELWRFGCAIRAASITPYFCCRLSRPQRVQTSSLSSTEVHSNWPRQQLPLLRTPRW